ncbi:MAG: hypothetical protein AAGH78_13650 [Cyanobacteria bacterium P01_H01_bin.58]
MGESNVLSSSAHSNAMSSAPREACSDYVAELQLHMALQARNLVPSLSQGLDSRQNLLHQTQATIEKMVSRQGF